MNSTKQFCECGKVASFLGYCSDCFANETQTVHEERRASMVETQFKPGDSVGAGKFTLIEKLGEGGMGSVWLARDEHLSGSEGLVEVALKFIGGGRSPNKFTIDLLRKEVLAARKLSHPNIVDVYDWHENSGEPEFYSMEYMPGLDLKELLKRQSKGRFTWKELNPLVEQLLDALEYAHEKFRLIHRDLKPANILVAPDGTVKLTDFGLAESASTGETFAATVGGTLLYASPGQRAGNAPSVADDIYSLSAVLYHLLTGHPPYAPEDLLREDVTPPPPRHPWHHLPRRDRRDIPAEAAATLMRCLRVEEGGGAPDMAAFRRWWRTGPPLEFETLNRTALVWRILKGFGAVGGAFLLLGFLYFLLHMPFFSESGPRITRHVDPFVPQWIQDSALGFAKRFGGKMTHVVAALTQSPEVETPPETKVVTKTDNVRRAVPAVLALQLDDYSAAQRWDPMVIVSQFRDQQWVSIHPEKPFHDFRDGPQINFTNLAAGLYRVEAGDWRQAKLEDRSTRYWMVDEVELTAGPSPVVRTLGMRAGALAVYASHQVPFEILDPWGKPASISGDKFEVNRVSTVSKLPFRVELPFPLSTPRAGHFQLRFPEENIRRARLEPHGSREVFVVAGVAETVELTFTPWQQARMDAKWVSPKSGIEFLPVGKGLNFMGGRTEVTVGQYRVFAEETQRPAQPLESVTTNGWEAIGRTWKTAFTNQTEGHPVVGVSWDDARAFCDWLTQRERELKQMGANQRYALPTAEQWTAMAAGGEYPWGGGYPPKPEDGNYAGPEVASAGWPGEWKLLTLETNAANSSRTVAVGQSMANALGLLDLGGNVAEWCDTWYRVGLNTIGTFSVPSKRLMDDRGGQTYRVVRGGSWFDSDPDLLKTAAHWAELPTRVNDRLGFRLVLIQEEGKP